MDVQQLPAVQGNSGYEYKVSLIHLKTRMKYSEIHAEQNTRLMADVLEKARARLPPFFLVQTDNALLFTMKHAHNSKGVTAFEKKAQQLGLIHTTTQKHSPWQNGFIERSNRTDNDELFTQIHFDSSEQRKYLLRLWEHEYNYKRPHQGLNGKTPFEVFKQQYPYHSSSWGIT